MVQESLSATEVMAKAVVQVMDAQLSADDRDREVEALLTTVQGLNLTPATNLTYVTDNANRGRRLGIQVLFTEPERLRPFLQRLGDRLTDSPVELRLSLTLGQVRLQVQSNDAEAFLTLLPILEPLLPARQLFQARAETYALRRGELSPVEQANLELLRYRLNLPVDEAEAMIARALGPYLDRQTKLQKYREVLNAELDRGYPLSDSTWKELQKLYQNLGLTYEDVSAIDQEYITRIKAEVTRLQQQEEATRLQQITQAQQAQQQTELQVKQDQTHRYRQEFQGAIAHTLYPSDFDRGRLEQARRLWEIDPEVARAIEREVTDAQYGAIDSGMGLDYSRLRQLLWAQQFEDADQETERLILTALSRDMRPIQPEALMKWSCLDVQTIDGLWARHSENRFGFRAQCRVFGQVSRREDEFLQRLGWQDALSIASVSVITRHKTYRDLRFNLDAPPGHLPTWRWGCTTLDSAYTVSDALLDALVLHFEKCLPGAIEGPSADLGNPG
ncbi:MAG: GUN4 domain-containing protein [Leptolyngbyaceae cyanobacterium T60_A2020_046]|nr:GUN4 domain-containing protein [Leptolyngbyaceae cyanobacterium T60_A2020_046]